MCEGKKRKGEEKKSCKSWSKFQKDFMGIGKSPKNSNWEVN